MTVPEKSRSRLPRPLHLALAALRHLRRGTLAAALGRRLAGETAPAAPVVAPAPRKPGRFNTRTPEEAASLLPLLAREAMKSRPGEVLVVGVPTPLREAVLGNLAGLGVPSRPMTLDEIDQLPATAFAGIGCILLATIDSREQLAAARRLVRHPAAAAVPLEYVAVPLHENAPIAEWDRLGDADFISPLLGEAGGAFYDIYRESLTRFKQKTEIRDYLDVCMILRSLAERQLAGNIAEFGSFWGHSGYLISRAAERLGLAARVYLFDMFENFPQEDVGVDAFWSGTHQVDFDTVRARFHDRPSVQFVKGDFTRTLDATDTGPLAFAFIDCDSYRATKDLLPKLWDGRLVSGGVVAMEDYGHGALLGNRVAVHEFFDGRRDAYTYFSQFSGLFIAVKLAPGTHGA